MPPPAAAADNSDEDGERVASGNDSAEAVDIVSDTYTPSSR